MKLPVVSKIKFLIRRQFDRLDQILGVIAQTENRSQLQTATLGHLEHRLRQLDGQFAALSQNVSVLIANNTLIVEALCRLTKGEVASRSTAQRVDRANATLDAPSQNVGLLRASDTLTIEALDRMTEAQAASRSIAQRLDGTIAAFDNYSSAAKEIARLLATSSQSMATLIGDLGSHDEALRLSSVATRELSESIASYHSIAAAGLHNGSDGQRLPFCAVATASLLALNPELRILDHLIKYLPCDVLIDVGAHKGAFAEFLLRCGYRVFSFEPNPDSFDALVSRTAGDPQFKGFQYAIGEQDGKALLTVPIEESAAGIYGDASLYCTLEGPSLPPGLVPERVIPVTMRSLSSLVLDGSTPDRVGILKIDAEGYELRVLAGATAIDADIVMAEFWGPDSPFNAQRAGAGNSAELHFALRGRGFSHLITFNRIHGSTEPMFYVNCPEATGSSWGNMMFFRDELLFRRALDWCDVSLRRIYLGTPPL